MSYLEVFGLLKRVGVEVSKYCGVEAGAGVLKPEEGAESESEKCDSALLCGRCGHGSGVPELTPVGFCVFPLDLV